MKSRDEAAIISAMGHISNCLPDLSVYRQIHRNLELDEMLLDAYINVIYLARGATIYLQRSTFSGSQSISLSMERNYTNGIERHVHSMTKTTGFEVMTQSMRENFDRVRLKCETLLARRVDELKVEVDEMRNNIESEAFSHFLSRAAKWHSHAAA